MVGMIIVLIVVLVLSYREEGFAPAAATPTQEKAVQALQASQALQPAPSAPADLSKGAVKASTTQAAQATHTSGSTPQRTDVKPQIGLSETAHTSSIMQQKSDLLKDIQMMIRNELLAARSTDASMKDSCGACGSAESASCGAAPSGAASCTSLSQGKEYSIKKDSIPCWGCTLDY